MVARNKKQRKKVPNSLSVGLGAATGFSGATALSAGYLVRKGQYQNMDKATNLYNGIKNGNRGVADSAISKEEAIQAAKQYLYNTDGTTVKESLGITQDYADSMMEQIENNPNLFKQGTDTFTDVLDAASGKNTIQSALTDYNLPSGASSDSRITADDLTGFWKNHEITTDASIRKEDLRKELSDYLKGLTTSKGEAKFTEDNVNAAVNAMMNKDSAFGNGQVVTQVLDEKNTNILNIFEKMSNKASVTNLKELFATGQKGYNKTATEWGKDSLILQETSKLVGGIPTEQLAKVAMVGGTTLGAAALAGLVTLFVKYVPKRLHNLRNKRAREQSQEVVQMKRGLSQAKAANAMRVQMAEDFENTASHGHFNNRG